MFTGIIEECGTVAAVKKNGSSALITISARIVLEGTKIGDSISVDGVCLTVTGINNDSLSFFVMNETVQRTTLKSISTGNKLNLERAVMIDTRLSGHLVSGHIDGTGKIEKTEQDNGAMIFTVSAPPEILRYIIYKGSVAIDGISLTCMHICDNSFKVSIIPHTIKVTTLKNKKAGDDVNIECDIIGKYVEKLMIRPKNNNVPEQKKSIEKLLEEAGF
ncbi:MAG: riboflavin synthase [Firmicutes bacterium]|nr:riboflavin synthase [Bacillota bacterium]